MSLFNNEENKSHKGTEEITSYEIKGKKKSKILFDFSYCATFKYGDKLTNLIKARILDNYIKGSSTSPDSAKYICFELPTYISLNKLLDEGVFDILDQIEKFEELQSNGYNHIGLIDRRTDERYELFEPTNEVIKYIQENMNKIIEEKEILFSKRIQQQEFRKRISQPAQTHRRHNEEVKEERKQNIFLEEQLRYKMGDGIYTDYIGTDVTEGKILKVNRVSKISEFEEEKLYSAFIDKKEELENEDDEENIMLQTIPNGFPVLFTLDDNIEYYLKNNDENEIRKILQLITDLPKEKININEICYIGGIDKEGRICRNIENCLQETIQKINEEKLKYKEKIKEKQISRI